MENKDRLNLKFTGFIILSIIFIIISPGFAEEYDVSYYLPEREDIGTEWKFPTSKSVYDEIENPFEKSGLIEYIWQGHIKGSGFETNFLDLYIYRFDSSESAVGFYNEHIDYWHDRRGYQEWLPDTVSTNDNCYGRITAGITLTDKISLYCLKNSMVIFVLSAGYEFEMKDEVIKFTNSVIKKINDLDVEQTEIKSAEAEYTNNETSELQNYSEVQTNKETKSILSFVDPNKDPHYYLDRYYNEPAYKEWFDTNYPDYTIEEAVGLSPAEENKTIPEWVKGIFAFYLDGKIDDEELIKALQFLIKEGIIEI